MPGLCGRMLPQRGMTESFLLSPPPNLPHQEGGIIRPYAYWILAFAGMTILWLIVQDADG